MRDDENAREERRFREKQMARFPGAFYGRYADVGVDWLAEFDAALSADDEQIMHKYIEQHPYVMSHIIQSGHHGVWFYSKQQIAMSKPAGESGAYPDFLVAGNQSEDPAWWIVEIKKPSLQFSVKSGDDLTSEASRGLVQCVRYSDHMSNYIDAIRALTGIKELFSIRRVVFLIGNSDIESEDQRRTRASFNRVFSSNVEVISYDRLRRNIRTDVEDRRGFSYF